MAGHIVQLGDRGEMPREISARGGLDETEGCLKLEEPLGGLFTSRGDDEGQKVTGWADGAYRQPVESQWA